MEIRTEHPVDKAASIIGSAAGLATLLGVSRSAVGQWKLDGRKVPAEYCPTIERATDRRVTCEDLRPDMDWAYIRAQTEPQPEQVS